jgi:hypothetical protein
LSWQDYRNEEMLRLQQCIKEQRQQAALKEARPHHRVKFRMHRVTVGCGLGSGRSYELLLYDHVTDDAFATVERARILQDDDAGADDSAAAAAVVGGRLLFDGWVKIQKPVCRNNLPSRVQHDMFHNELATAEDNAAAAANEAVLPALWAVGELAIWYGYENCYCLLAPASTSVRGLLKTDMYQRRQWECEAQQQAQAAEPRQVQQKQRVRQRRQQQQLRRQQQRAE